MNGAPQATVEALLYDIRTRGLAAIADQSRRYRIAVLTDQQLNEVCECLVKKCPACLAGAPIGIISVLKAAHTKEGGGSCVTR
jgi:hypothetical protein